MAKTQEPELYENSRDLLNIYLSKQPDDVRVMNDILALDCSMNEEPNMRESRAMLERKLANMDVNDPVVNYNMAMLAFQEVAAV